MDTVNPGPLMLYLWANQLNGFHRPVTTITKTCPCNIQRFFFNDYYENCKFHETNFDIFNVFAQNIHCGYMLEVSAMYVWIKIRKLGTSIYPCKPQFFYIKVGFMGVYITRTCFPKSGLVEDTD